MELIIKLILALVGIGIFTYVVVWLVCKYYLHEDKIITDFDILKEEKKESGSNDLTNYPPNQE